MDFASLQGSSTSVLDADSSWVDSCLSGNLDMSTSSTNDRDALKDALDEIAYLKESRNADQRTSAYEKEIYNALLQAKGIKSIDDLQNDYVFSLPELELGLDVATDMSATKPEDSIIFKVWDLNMEFEEGEFDQELKKALADIDSVVQQDAFVTETIEKEEPYFILNEQGKEDLDILASLMADLSLNSNVPEK